MPVRVWKNAYLRVAGEDLSGHVQSLALSYEAESLDATAMGSSSRVRQGGLKSQGLDVTMFFNTTCVEQLLYPLVGCQTCIEVRACNACSCDSNARYQGTWLLPSFPPLSGAVGDLMTVAVRFEPAGDLSRSVATT